MRVAALLPVLAAAALLAPGHAGAGTWTFSVVGAGYQDYSVLNDVASSGYTFINQSNRTWLSPDGTTKADQVPLPAGFDKSIAHAINAGHRLTGEVMDFGPPNFRAPFLWDAVGGTVLLAGLSEYNASFGPTDPAHPRANVATDLTDDGGLVFGYGWSPISEHPWVGWVWTSDDGFRTLPVDAGYFVPQPLWIDDADGSIYGVAQDAGAAWHRVRWIPPAPGTVPVETGAGRPRLLSAPAPNPFRSATAFRVDVPAAVAVRVTVRDVRGREVAAIFEGSAAGGPLDLAWTGRDGRGRPVAAGCYVIVVEADGARDARKVLQLP